MNGSSARLDAASAPLVHLLVVDSDGGCQPSRRGCGFSEAFEEVGEVGRQEPAEGIAGAGRLQHVLERDADSGGRIDSQILTLRPRLR